MTRIQQLDPSSGELRPYYSITAAYMWWLFTGLLGGHWFYLGRRKLGAVYFLTAGFLGVGWLLDGINMYDHVRLRNST